MRNVEFDHLVNVVEETLERGEGSLSETVRSLFVIEKLASELEETLKDVMEQNEEVRKAIERIKKTVEGATSVISEAYLEAVRDLENDPEVQAQVERLLRKALGS